MNKLSIFDIAVRNIKKQQKRSILLVILLSLLSFSLLSGLLISANLQNGIDTMSRRFGADLMVVPLENDDDMEGILLQGTPSRFYFDKTLADEIVNLEGVEQVASQFYLQSLDAGCCSMPVQIIGYDPDTDFSISPWIETAFDDATYEYVGKMIVGSEIYVNQSNTLEFFDERYAVTSQLHKTGTGLDYGVYVDIETIPAMIEAAKLVGVEFETNEVPSESVSTVLINIKEGYYKEKVIHDVYTLAADMDIDVNIIEAQSLTQELGSNISNLSMLLSLYSVLFIVTSFITLHVVFSLIIGERKKEFAIMRILGATKKIVAKSMLLEAFAISGVGAIVGSGLSMLLISSFSTFIETSLGLPYINIAITTQISMILITILITALVGPLAVLTTVSGINKAETFITMKEGE